MLSSFRFVMWGQLSLTPWGQIRKTRSKSSERCTQWLWIQDADMEGLGCGHDLWQIAVPDTGTGTEDSTFGWIDQDAGFLRFFLNNSDTQMICIVCRLCQWVQHHRLTRTWSKAWRASLDLQDPITLLWHHSWKRDQQTSRGACWTENL